MKIKVLAAALLPLGVVLTTSNTSAAEQTLGALFQFSGNLGANPVSGSIYDGDIHSGVFRDVNASPSLLSGSPVLSDSYVLQGGDPFGGDTGDNFEVSQADGHATVGGFGITTHYDFGQPGTQVGNFIFANPDTGVLTFQNNNADEFVGVITLSGTAFGGIYGPAQFFSNSGPVDLKPGESAQIVLNNESSNYGGYNHPSVVPDGGSTAVLFGIGATSMLAYRRRSAKR